MTEPQTERPQHTAVKQKRKYTLDPNNKPGPTPHIEILYKTVDAFDKKVAAYFDGGAYKRKIILQDGVEVAIPTPTISDLVLFLGFVNRKSFLCHEDHPLFGASVKRAKTMIEREYETLLRSQSCTGAIFALKNFDWHDRPDINQPNGDVRITNIVNSFNIDDIPVVDAALAILENNMRAKKICQP